MGDANNLSAETQASLQRRTIQESDDYYPHATTLGRTSPYTTVKRFDWDEVPRTTIDISKAMTWQHGQTLYGTHAKDDPALKRYRKDIDKAYGQEKNYKHIYVDTFNTKKPMAQKMKEALEYDK